METDLVALLTASQSSESGPRLAAELSLKAKYQNPLFPVALVDIAANDQIATNNRQAALNVLHLYVKKGWSDHIPGFQGVHLAHPETRNGIRQGLLSIVFDDNADSKVTSGAAIIITRIALADYPYEWPGLFDDILGKLPGANNAQTLGILTVLATIIDSGGIDENAFRNNFERIMSSLHGVATNDALRPQTRAYALRSVVLCFGSIWLLKQNDKKVGRFMGQRTLDMFSPFFLQVLTASMPALPTKEQEDQGGKEAMEWRDMVLLKTQVIKVLDRMLKDFRSLFNSSVTMLFEVVFKCLQDHGEAYTQLYVDTDLRQSKSLDAHDLPYTFDLLVLEEIDYLANLLLAPELKRQLSTTLFTDAAWANQIMSILVTYGSVAAEDEGMWAIDINVFLQGETNIISSSYIARDAIATKMATACVEEKPKEFMSSAVDVMHVIFGREDSTWKQKEAILFLIQTMVDHLYHEKSTFLPEIAYTSIDCIRSAFTDDNNLLRARAYRVAATVLTCSGPAFHDMAAQVAVQTLDACANEDSELIQAMCIRATMDYNRYVPQPAVFEIQAKAIVAISKLLDAQDMEDFADDAEYLSDTLLEALRDAVIAAPRASLQHGALPVLFKLLRYSPYSTATVDLALGAFQAIVQEISREGKDEYFGLCIHVLPALMEAIDTALVENNELYGECTLTMLEYLTQHTPLGLPQEFIASVMPKLCRIIFMDSLDASFLHQRATSVIQLMISHEPALVFAWQDPEIHKSGLEMTTLIIERLLGPQTDDVSAAEVGSLAVELVSKADVETVRPLIPNLLSVSAARLLSAKHHPLIQSLSMLFAHLALLDAGEVLSFLTSIKPLGHDHAATGLDTVLKKWVDSSVNFVGSDAIKTNIMALANIYKLDDARLKAIRVEGDLIVSTNTTSRIKTRSAAKKEPDRYEVISLQLKILKAIIAELPPDLSPVPGSANNAAALQQALFASPTRSTHRGGGSEYSGSDEDDEDDDDDGWSDASDESLDSAAAAAARHSHRHSFNFEGFVGGVGDFFTGGARDYDNVVVGVLLEFFVSVAGEAGFQAQIHELNEGERTRLRALDGLARARQGRFSLGE